MAVTELEKGVEKEEWERVKEIERERQRCRIIHDVRFLQGSMRKHFTPRLVTLLVMSFLHR